MRNLSTNTMTIFLIITIILLFLEGAFLHNGMIFFALIGLFLLYISFKKQHRNLFWFSILCLIIALLSMWSLRILLVIALIYILVQIKKGTPIEIDKNVFSSDKNRIKNKFFSFDESASVSYTWSDVQLQHLAGEIIIDATNTILPKSTSFINIRQGFGNVIVYVPYEIPIRIHYNTIVGEAKLIGNIYPRLWNEAIHIKDGYDDQERGQSQELVIIVSSFMGDLEVTRK